MSSVTINHFISQLFLHFFNQSPLLSILKGFLDLFFHLSLPFSLLPHSLHLVHVGVGRLEQFVRLPLPPALPLTHIQAGLGQVQGRVSVMFPPVG